MNTVLFVYLIICIGTLLSVPQFWTLFDNYFFEKIVWVNLHFDDGRFKSTSPDEFLDYANYIDEIICANEVYLNSKISLVLLADLIKENPKKLNEAIYFKYGISFKDYINLKRLDFIDRIFFSSDGNYKKYSFDYISEKAGFGTRKSLYLSIRKLKNCTPLEYFKR